MRLVMKVVLYFADFAQFIQVLIVRDPWIVLVYSC